MVGECKSYFDLEEADIGREIDTVTIGQTTTFRNAILSTTYALSFANDGIVEGLITYYFVYFTQQIVFEKID